MKKSLYSMVGLERYLGFRAVLFLVIIGLQMFPGPLIGQEEPAFSPVTHETITVPKEYLGSWTGTRLRCERDESGPVRCGTPSSFKMSLRHDGTGTCRGQYFPPEFIYKLTDRETLIVTSLDKSNQWKFFDLKLEEGFLTFHLYIYPDGVEGVEAKYIHYVFDLARDEESPELTTAP